MPYFNGISFLVPGLREFICINGASVAPVIALDLVPGVSFLDLCSGPGTKSLLSYMTTCPDTMTCNDVDAGRLRRVRTLFKEFLGNGYHVTSKPVLTLVLLNLSVLICF